MSAFGRKAENSARSQVFRISPEQDIPAQCSLYYQVAKVALLVVWQLCCGKDDRVFWWTDAAASRQLGR